MTIIDVAIVGGGAAGLATAIFTRRLAPSLSVAVLDGATKPGAKILISGGSRCNVTNRVVGEQDFWGGRPTIVRRVLRALPVERTIDFFAELGIQLHEEEHGKLFPDSNRSRDVLDALMREIRHCGADLSAGTRVTGIARAADAFRISTHSGELRARRVVLATGGRSLPKTGSDGAGYGFAEALGHTIVPTTPGLAPLRLGDGARAVHGELSGVAQDVDLSVWVDGSLGIRRTGALLWTHFGVSGPVVLDASRHWLRARLEGRETRVTVCFLPGETFGRIDRRLAAIAADRPRAALATALSNLLPASTAAALLRRLSPDPSSQLAHFGRERRRELAHALAEWPLDVVDSRGYNYAEVTAGGVALDEIDPSTMESRRCPGLFLVGEILDVDGRIGGFNFQWAWSSARAAAAGLARAR